MNNSDQSLEFELCSATDVLLYRISAALEDLVELKRTELSLTHPEFARTGKVQLKSSKLAQVSVADPERWSAEYEKRKTERLMGGV